MWNHVESHLEPCFSCERYSGWMRSNFSVVKTIVLLAGLMFLILEICRWLTR